jgi:hypothetical protein
MGAASARMCACVRVKLRARPSLHTSAPMTTARERSAAPGPSAAHSCTEDGEADLTAAPWPPTMHKCARAPASRANRARAACRPASRRPGEGLVVHRKYRSIRRPDWAACLVERPELRARVRVALHGRCEHDEGAGESRGRQRPGGAAGPQERFQQEATIDTSPATLRVGGDATIAPNGQRPTANGESPGQVTLGQHSDLDWTREARRPTRRPDRARAPRRVTRNRVRCTLPS